MPELPAAREPLRDRKLWLVDSAGRSKGEKKELSSSQTPPARRPGQGGQHWLRALSFAFVISYSFSPRPSFPLPPPTPPTSTGPLCPFFPICCPLHVPHPSPLPSLPSLRNLSSADAGRQTMRNYTGLIDALMAYVQNCVAASRCDDKVSACPLAAQPGPSGCPAFPLWREPPILV